MFGCCTSDCGTSEPIGLPVEDEAGGFKSSEAEMLAQVRATQQERLKLPDTGAPLVERVALTRSTAQDPWGFEVEAVSGLEAVLVNRIVEGSAREFNKAAVAGAYQLQKYDFIVAANGKTGHAELLRTLQSDTNRLDLIVARPSTESAVLRKDEGPLGLALKHTEKGSTVIVREISETGYVAKAGCNIRKNDVIIASDGVMGTGKELVQALQSPGCPKITLLRLDPAAFVTAESK